MFQIASRRRSLKTLEQAYPGARIIDVTSKSEEPWIRFSPFWPHGQIPIPYTEGFAMSVEGVWQALKVFEKEDVDPSKLAITSMKGIKRSARRLGKVQGHRKGLEGTELLTYLEARRKIYLPTYRYVLDHALQEELQLLRNEVEQSPGGAVLLDYETNDDIEELSRPLSHAALIVRYLKDDWPS